MDLCVYEKGKVKNTDNSVKKIGLNENVFKIGHK